MNTTTTTTTTRIETPQGSAWIIDNVFDDKTLESMDQFRLSLKLDSKRPTVDRRFFADAASTASFFAAQEEEDTTTTTTDKERPLASRIEDAIARSKMVLQGDDDDDDDNDDDDDKLLQSSQQLMQQEKKKVHVLRYQRFLEYTKSGSGLDPHTDGTKVCCDHPDMYTSTHTLLLYLTDCERGGETVLLSDCGSSLQQKKKYSMLYACAPRRGRLLLFPHATPHAGMPVVDLPKICLRAEVCLRTTV
jgi:hypothetical protein